MAGAAAERTGYDLAVIGSGPGGYVAAVRAAQLGMRVAVVEKAELGGICGNWGCIPTKALLRSAEVLDLMRRATEFGLRADNVGFDFAAVIARSRKVADMTAKGVGFLFKKNQIDHLAGTARLVSLLEGPSAPPSFGGVPLKGPSAPPSFGGVPLKGPSAPPSFGGGPARLLVDGKEVAAKQVLLATGARPKALPGIEHDGDRVLSYKEAMALAAQPASLVIIGAGAIGIEFAYFYAELGTRVTVVEALDRILPVEDEEISQALAKSLARMKIEILVGAKVQKLERAKDRVTLSVTDAKGAGRQIEAERALLAVGVRGNVEGLGLEDVGVKTERGFVVVERGSYRTSVDGIYAIGDLVGPPLLAHKASAEGIACVERLAGLEPARSVDYGSIPACTYCRPEVASVGLTEKQAREAGHEVRVGRFPLRALGKARAAGETDGFVKVVLGKHGELLGAHLLGGAATELIAELTLGKTAELTTDELLMTVHAHPTFAEAVREAVGEALGEAIDV